MRAVITHILRLFCRHLCLLVICIPLTATGQLQSVTAFTGYSFATGKRMNVEHASAVGGGTSIRFGLYENLSFGVSFGYTLYSISQKDQLTAWNWDFWNSRYSNTIRSNIQADPNLSVQIGSVQKIDLLPVTLDLDYRFALNEETAIAPSLSAGAVFFTRRLFAIETWSKKFAAANYTFTYSYRNFAPEKKGTAFIVTPGIAAFYRLFESADIHVGAYYTQYGTVGGMVGAHDFPLDNEVNISAGLDFFY
jgi:hypothetical protein